MQTLVSSNVNKGWLSGPFNQKQHSPIATFLLECGSELLFAFNGGNIPHGRPVQFNWHNYISLLKVHGNTS